MKIRNIRPDGENNIFNLIKWLFEVTLNSEDFVTANSNNLVVTDDNGNELYMMIKIAKTEEDLDY